MSDVSVVSYNIATINLNGISNLTKIESFKSFVRLMELDIVMMQEVEGEYFEMYGFDIIYNIDQNKRGTAIAIKSHINYNSVEKSLDSRLIKIKIANRLIICNIYAPSGSHNRTLREAFFAEVVPYYLRNSSECLVVGGDFNCIESSIDSSNERCTNYSTNLRALIRELRLQDAWASVNVSCVG